MKKRDRTGEENHNNFGTLMRIVECKNARDIIVEFQDEHKEKVHATYDQFKKGNVKNPYDKEIFNVGYLGVGAYTPKKHKKNYSIWWNMIKRCYDPCFLNEYPTYRDCYVCEEWLCFQNFAKWYEENVYNCNNERMHLDKDILIKGNKIYSPETCVLVPQRINVLFVKCDASRGKYPIGVLEYYDKRYNYKALCSRCGILDKETKKKKQKSLGYFPLDKPFQAFYTYKVFKEDYIKQVADEYKNLIPQKLYDALYRYEVEIND